MARMEAAVFIGLLLGSLVSGQLYGLTSASAVFGCACLCTLLGFFFIFAFLKESIKNETDINGFCVRENPNRTKYSNSICNSKYFFILFRVNSKHYLIGITLSVYSVHAQNAERTMIAFRFGSLYSLWHRQCLFLVN